MLSSRPCTTAFVIDDAPVTLTYYPDTRDLRVSDVYGTCIQKARWLGSWTALLATLREFAQLPHAAAHDASAPVSNRLGIANANYIVARLPAAAR